MAPPPPSGPSRRTVVAGMAALVGGAALNTAADALSQVPPAATGGGSDPTRTPGRLASGRGAPSPHAALERTVVTDQVSFTPIEGLDGVVTPAGLHFERHHAGVPDIDPARHRLLVHGMVDRPTTFTMEDLRRFPRESRLCFIECSGNGGRGFRGRSPDTPPHVVDGLLSTSEWTGVALSTVLREVGVRPGGSWILAEGSDAAMMTRSVPTAKAMDDALLAFAQNGEAIRPEQGFPLRLVLPGWEGNAQVKWLRRLEVGDGPFMTREETSHYTDPLEAGTARQFSFVMDAKSIITFPAYPALLGEPGWWEVTGLAWSGRGRIERVEVSADGGRTWADARLQEPVLPRCPVRFRHVWRWGGEEAVLASRATDETGYVQPTLATLRDTRGAGTRYHYNSIRSWRVSSDGRVSWAGGAV